MTQKDWTQRKCEVSNVAWLRGEAAGASVVSVVCWHSKRKAQQGLWLAVQVYSSGGSRALLPSV